MKVKIHKIKQLTLKQFAEHHDLTLEVFERDNPKLNKYYCNFSKCEVKERSMLASVAGNGNTITEAKDDYAKRISGQLLVFNAYGAARREILCPHLKLKGKQDE